MIAAVGTAGFALVHIFIGRLHFLDVVPRSRWLSFAGGIAVAYVFLHILPELSHRQGSIADTLETNNDPGQMIYLIALAGLAAFYGLERAAQTSRQRSPTGSERKVETEVFWLHIGAFGTYNVLIGYLLLHRETEGTASLVMFFLAMALHFVTTDFALRDHHRILYDHKGRWVLTLAVVLGWGLGVMVDVPDTAVDVLFAFLAGAVILNVLKEELPENRQSRFWPFAAGVGAYAAMLQV